MKEKPLIEKLVKVEDRIMGLGDNPSGPVNSAYYNPKKTWENTQDSYEYMGGAEAIIKPAVFEGKDTYHLLYYKEK